MRKSHVSLLAFACVGMTACGLGTKSKEVRHEAKVRKDIIGVWDSTCIPSALEANRYNLLRYDVGPTQGFTFTTTQYLDAACQSQDLTIDVRGTLSYPQEIREGSNQVDFKTSDVVILPDTAEAAQRLNAEKRCGFTDWQQGYEKSVVGKDCGFMKLDQDATLKELFEVRDHTLLLGIPQLLKSTTSDEARPTSVDMGTPFTERQS